ncbi:hypothetical protein TCAL_17105 [Tigriopus californicus]|uniref:G-protein coupled receptors family 1 profile domain-containing protein n=1 Tax=Tigriopus californicus TaxID=6832 RepID=A0A553P324_TIGCA|nr:hypothetical protein TCAL_17105 [Tigriopus californicus]
MSSRFRNITWDVFRNSSVVSHCYNLRFGPELSEDILSNLSYLPNGYNIPFTEFSNKEGLACHWAFFETPSNVLFYLMGSLYAIIAFFGLIGNGLVILIFCRSPLLQTTSNVLIVSLSLSDFIMVLKTPMAAFNNFVQYPAMGHTGLGEETIQSIERNELEVMPCQDLSNGDKDNQAKVEHLKKMMDTKFGIKYLELVM